jgi:hypothetical protein
MEESAENSTIKSEVAEEENVLEFESVVIKEEAKEEFDNSGNAEDWNVLTSLAEHPVKLERSADKSTICDLPTSEHAVSNQGKPRDIGNLSW